MDARHGLAVVAAMLLGMTSIASAATFVVNSTNDTDDGSCDPAPADCTLREAIDDVNAAPDRDTITFDIVEFPLGATEPIEPTTALPPITQPSGVTVDGTGAGVLLDGNQLGGGESGLVVESGGGVPLTNVTVRGIRIVGFPGDGLAICGGSDPGCDSDVSKTRVEHVVASGNGSTGIRIDGRANTGTRLESSTAVDNDGSGVSLTSGPNENIEKARITNTTAVRNGGTGINVNASGDNVSPRITDCGAHHNDSRGVNVNAGDNVTGAQIKNTTATNNGNTGINVNAGDDAVGTKLTSCHSADNSSGGISVNAERNLKTKVTKSTGLRNEENGLSLIGSIVVSKGTVADSTFSGNQASGISAEGDDLKITKVLADGNVADGIRLVADAPTSGSKVTKCRASGNTENGIAVAMQNLDNKITKNTALGNGANDLFDGNVGCATNDWSKNAFDTSNDTCIE